MTGCTLLIGRSRAHHYKEPQQRCTTALLPRRPPRTNLNDVFGQHIAFNILSFLLISFSSFVATFNRSSFSFRSFFNLAFASAVVSEEDDDGGTDEVVASFFRLSTWMDTRQYEIDTLPSL